MKRSASKNIDKTKKGQSEKFVSEPSKRDEVNPKHRRDFDQLLDDAILGVPKPKKK